MLSGSDDSSSSSEQETEYAVQTENRFERHDGRGSDWQQVRRKRKKISSGSIDADSFSSLSSDDKLLCLFGNLNRNFDILNDMKKEQSQNYKVTQDLQIGVTRLCERAERAERVIDKQSQCIKMLTYHSIDTEARSRRNNIIIWGITEKARINVECLVLGFIEDELDIDPSDICIDRAHRLGSANNAVNKQDPKRPIIVRFRDYRDTERVMKNAYKLKGSPFGMDRDYPKEISVARRELYQSAEAKAARQNRQKLQISYPAKMYVDGRLVCDKFPEWHRVLGESRLKGFDFENVTERVDGHPQSDRQNREQNTDRRHGIHDRTLYSNETLIDSDRRPSFSDDSVFTSTQKQVNSENKTARHAQVFDRSHDQSYDQSHGMTSTQHAHVEKKQDKCLPDSANASQVKKKSKHRKSKGSKTNGTPQVKSFTQHNETQTLNSVNNGSSADTQRVPDSNTQTINRSGTNQLSQTNENRAASDIDNSGTRL